MEQKLSAPVTLRLLKEDKDKKPVPPKNLKEKVKEKDTFLDSPLAVTAKEPVGFGRKVLVVDDNPVVLKAFEMKLKADGFEVVTQDNASLVASTASREKAHLILLDISFPASGSMEWTGFTILQWIRRFPDLLNLPVIFVTGSDSAQFREKAMKAGAEAFFEKPVDYQELRAAIVRALDIRQPAG
jgi:CheY-like chemotaxis protein